MSQRQMARSKYLGQIAACYLVRVIGGNSNGSHFSMTDEILFANKYRAGIHMTISNLLMKLPKLLSSSELFFVAMSAHEKAESCPSGRMYRR